MPVNDANPDVATLLAAIQAHHNTSYGSDPSSGRSVIAAPDRALYDAAGVKYRALGDWEGGCPVTMGTPAPWDVPRGIFKVPCRYPQLCGQEWCECELSPEDVRLMDQNVAELESRRGEKP